MIHIYIIIGYNSPSMHVQVLVGMANLVKYTLNSNSEPVNGQSIDILKPDHIFNFHLNELGCT